MGGKTIVTARSIYVMWQYGSDWESGRRSFLLDIITAVFMKAHVSESNLVFT